MQENLQTAQDIFNRNTHSNPFQIKLPSHHASQQNINVMAQAFILNKLALLPFYQNQKLTQLYKSALEFLINQNQEKYKNEEYVEGIVVHLQNWQVNMSLFGVWPYTRACFYYIEERLKDRKECMERVMLQRGILEPNKQDFINKSQNVDFKSEKMKLLVSICNKQSLPLKEESYQLPKDILLIDSNECWLQLEKKFEQNQLVRQDIQDYLNEYQKKGIMRYLRKNIRKDYIKEVLEGLRLRSKVFTFVMGFQSQKFEKTIVVLQTKSGK